MVGVIGVNKRIFSTLADNGISVFIVSQASSENSTSFGVRSQDAELSRKVLNKEFENEIALGSINEAIVEYDLATIAIVGQNMRHVPASRVSFLVLWDEMVLVLFQWHKGQVKQIYHV
jgi:aspartokinase/homoserine dehydrogenase 1